MSLIMTQNDWNRKRRLTAALLSLLALLAAPPLKSAGQAAPASNRHLPQIAWSFELRHDRSLTPHCSVFLRVGGKQFLVLPQALTACTGWFAGQGTTCTLSGAARS